MLSLLSGKKSDLETITPIASVAYVGLWVTRLLHSTKSSCCLKNRQKLVSF